VLEILIAKWFSKKLLESTVRGYLEVLGLNDLRLSGQGRTRKIGKVGFYSVFSVLSHHYSVFMYFVPFTEREKRRQGLACFHSKFHEIRVVIWQQIN
jgi:hypothetical protein